jgi:hypothetical protein
MLDIASSVLYFHAMTSSLTVARVAATEPSLGHALHVCSRIRGRLDALEAAIAARDARARLRVLLEVLDLFEELRTIDYQRAA